MTKNKISGEIMASFLFAVNAVLPIILMVVLGYVLKKLGWMTPAFAEAANKLAFHVFLPVLLFSNVYKISSPGEIELGYIFYTLLAVFLIFLVSIPMVFLVTKENDRRGPLLQSTFRSNFAHVGIPLAMSMFGDGGVATASLLSTALIPLLNVLAVISLSMFRKGGEKVNVKNMVKGMIKNPLIHGVVLGILFLLLREGLAAKNIAFDLMKLDFIAKPINYLAGIATPLALISLGAQFEFSAAGEMKKEILFGVIVRTVIVPVSTLGIALGLGIFSGAHFASFVAAFATPVAIASVPMAQEMGADSALAGQLVVWTTVVSAVTVFLFTYFLKLAGIF